MVIVNVIASPLTIHYPSTWEPIQRSAPTGAGTNLRGSSFHQSSQYRNPSQTILLKNPMFIHHSVRYRTQNRPKIQQPSMPVMRARFPLIDNHPIQPPQRLDIPLIRQHQLNRRTALKFRVNGKGETNWLGLRLHQSLVLSALTTILKSHKKIFPTPL